MTRARETKWAAMLATVLLLPACSMSGSISVAQRCVAADGQVLDINPGSAALIDYGARELTVVDAHGNRRIVSYEGMVCKEVPAAEKRAKGDAP